LEILFLKRKTRLGGNIWEEAEAAQPPPAAGERRQLPAVRLVAHGGMGIFFTGGTEGNLWEKQHRVAYGGNGIHGLGLDGISTLLNGIGPNKFPPK
jgi:hypothetical protein